MGSFVVKSGTQEFCVKVLFSLWVSVCLSVFGFAVLRQDYRSVAQASPKLRVTLSEY